MKGDIYLIRSSADIFKYEPGMDVNAPIPLKSVTGEELAVAGIDIQFQARWEMG